VTRPSRFRASRRVLLLLVGLVAIVAIVIVAQPLWAFDVLASVWPQVVWRVRTAQPLVGLSFDDGPSAEHTPRVLEILAKHNARATFFLIGARAAEDPATLNKIRSAGHEVGNHCFTIRSITRGSDQEFVANLLQTEAALGLLGTPKLFRPPGGRFRASQLALAEAHGYRTVLGSAYPYDAHVPSGYIRWLVTKNLAPGVIVILHDGIPEPSRMISVLDAILTAGEGKGLRFVTVGELLSASAR
jgi:peptidoglycan-N-acetylglucosamine deacetylase